MSDPAGFADPYVYPGSLVLRNLLNETDAAALDQVEYELTFLRREELARDPISGRFDLARLQETHRRLFQDVYPWAGEIRTVEIRKGSSQFHFVEFIRSGAAATFAWLQDSGLLRPDVDDDTFIALCSDLLEKITHLHPFREGNGRAQRAFLDQVAEVSGRRLAWRNISQREHTLASIRAFQTGSGEPFRSIVAEVINPPLDGLSPLEPSVYQVSTRASGSTDGGEVSTPVERSDKR